MANDKDFQVKNDLNVQGGKIWLNDTPASSGNQQYATIDGSNGGDLILSSDNLISFFESDGTTRRVVFDVNDNKYSFGDSTSAGTTDTQSEMFHVSGSGRFTSSLNVNGSIIGLASSDGSATADSGNSHSLVNNVFLNPSPEAGGAIDIRTINELAGLEKWGSIYAVSGFYTTRTNAGSSESPNFSYSNEVTSITSGNMFDGVASTAGSWFTDNGTDGTTAGTGTFTLGFAGKKELDYTCYVGIVFGSHSFTPKKVKIEVYRGGTYANDAYSGGSWTTLCDLTNNSEINVSRRVPSGSSVGVQQIRYTLGGVNTTSSTYFRVQDVYAVDHDAGSNSGPKGIHYVRKYGDSDIYGNLLPATDSTYTLGDSDQFFSGVYSDKIYLNAVSSTSDTDKEALFLDGTEVKKRTLGSNAFNSTSFLPLTGGSLTGALNVTVDGSQLVIKSSTNATGAKITMSDHTTNDADQEGTITFKHSDSHSYGSGAMFEIGSNQSTTTILNNGKLMYDEGIYSKPPGSNAADANNGYNIADYRKDQNWDSAYNDKINSASFSTSDGILTLTQQDSGTVTVDLDGRFETISNVGTYLERGFKNFEAGTQDLAAGWYTIAVVTQGRASARFAVWDARSSRHQSVHFYASHHYGTDASNNITVLHASNYNTSEPIRHIRIKELGTYDGAALQVYVELNTNALRVAMFDDVQSYDSQGWILKDWVADDTDPGDVSTASNSTNGTTSAWSQFAQAAKVDLQNIYQGGIATTGEIYAGGRETQYKYLNTNSAASDFPTLNQDTTGTADHVKVTDNEATNEENLITFVENAQSSTGGHGLEMDGNLTYNPSTGTITSTKVSTTDLTATSGTFTGKVLANDFSKLNGKNVNEITVGTKIQSQNILAPRVITDDASKVFYAALENNTRLYKNNEHLVTLSKGTAGSIAAADISLGDIIHADRPIALRQNGRPLASLASTGSFFIGRNRADNAQSRIHFGIYAPYADGRVKYIQADTITPTTGYVDFSDSNEYDASTNVNGWKTVALTQGTVSQLTVQATTNGSGNVQQNYYWIQSDTPVVITSCTNNSSTWTGAGADGKLLKEVTREILSYDEGNQVKYDPDNTGTITVSNSGSWRYSRSEGSLLFAHHDEGDGDGTDGTQGIPWKMCGDTYIVDHGLRGYQIATIEPSIVSSYYWNGTAWVLYKTHDLSAASRDSFVAHSEGNDNKGVDNTNFIGQANSDKPWRFIGTGRFALRTNNPSSDLSEAGNADEEYMVLGYDSNLRSQEVIRVGKIIAEDISASAVTGDKIASNTTITVGPANDIKVGLDGTGSATDEVRMFAGDTLANKASAPFQVKHDGALVATSATITGAITATSGTFTGAVNASSGTFTGDVSTNAKFTAGNVGIDGASGDTNTVRIFAGNATPDNATFKVTDGGAVTATSGTIGGFTLGSTSLISGTNATRISLHTSNGIHLGDNSFGSAPFRVTPAGALTATNATITGAVTATSGSFTGDITANDLSLASGLTIGQTNLSSEPAKLGVVKRLNSDPFFAHAGGTDYWFNDADLHGGGQNSVAVDADADTTYKTDGSNLPTGKSTYLQIVDNNDDSDNFVNSQYFTIDSTKTYKITVWARQTAGDRANYLLVDFRDDSNQKINNASNPTAANDGSTGWASIGTYHYWAVANQTFGSDWTKYEVEFGNNVSSVTPPNGAVKFSVGGLLTRGGSSETTVEICQYIVEEFDNNATSNAAITDLAGVTITDKKLFQGAGTHNNSDTGFYLDDTGKFSLKDKLSFDGSNLTVSGNITATDLNISNANVTGQLSASNIKIGTTEFEADGSGNLSIKAGGIVGSRIQDSTLDLLNNTSKSGNVNRWGGIDDEGSGSVATGLTLAYDSTEKAIKYTATNVDDTYIRSQGFDIDHNAIYRITLSIKASSDLGNIYVGATQSTGDIASSSSSGGGNGQTGLDFTYWNADRTNNNGAGNGTSNFYFFASSSNNTSYRHLDMFILGSNVNINNVPDENGEASNPYVKVHSTAKQAGLRILNWDNTTSDGKDVFVKDIEVTKIVPFDIIADNITTTNLSAISSDLGTITGGSLAIGSNDEFTVTNAGALTATGATITGAITATSGSIADSVTIGVRDEDRFASKIGWNFESGKQGWTTTGTTAYTHNSGGYVVIDSSGTDPIFLSPTGLNLDGNLSTKVLVSLRRTAGTGWHGALFYDINNGHSFEEANKHLISTDPTGGTASSDFIVVEWDMANQSSGSSWTGSETINQIRLDLGNSTDDTFEVNWVAIGERGANALQEGATIQDGKAGGWTIDGDSIFSGTKKTTDAYSASAGDITISSSGAIRAHKFLLKADGNAHFKGDISAATGTLSNSIRIGSGESVFSADGNGIYLGNETFNDAEFRVTPAGALTATNATVTGTINASAGAFTGGVTSTSTFKVGPSGAEIVGIDGSTTGGVADADEVRIFAGHATKTSAPFQVLGDGGLIATDASINGTVTATTLTTTDPTAIQNLTVSDVANGAVGLDQLDQEVINFITKTAFETAGGSAGDYEARTTTVNHTDGTGQISALDITNCEHGSKDVTFNVIPNAFFYHDTLYSGTDLDFKLQVYRRTTGTDQGTSPGAWTATGTEKSFTATVTVQPQNPAATKFYYVLTGWETFTIQDQNLDDVLNLDFKVEITTSPAFTNATSTTDGNISIYFNAREEGADPLNATTLNDLDNVTISSNPSEDSILIYENNQYVPSGNFKIDNAGKRISSLGGDLKLSAATTQTSNTGLTGPYHNVILQYTTNTSGGSTYEDRLEVTPKGIHVGTDALGTYTAGGGMSNNDIGFGICAGESISNSGWTNIVVGHSTTVSSTCNLNASFGYKNLISGGADRTFSSGAFNKITAHDSAAIGEKNEVTGNYSLAVGGGDSDGIAGGTGANFVSGRYAISVGYLNNNSGDSSAALGSFLDQNGNYGICVGYECINNSLAGFAGGYTDNDNSKKVTVSSQGAFAYGSGPQIGTAALNSTAFGKQTRIGMDADYTTTNRDADQAFVAGYDNTVYGHNALAFGRGNIVKGCENGGAFGRGNTIGGAGVEDDDNTSNFAIGANLYTPYDASNDSVQEGCVVVGRWNKFENGTAVGGASLFAVGTGTGPSAGSYSNFQVRAQSASFSGILMKGLAESNSYSSAPTTSQVPTGGLYRKASGGISYVMVQTA